MSDPHKDHVKRAALFMAELGRADAMAQVEQRSGVDGSLQDALLAYRDRWAGAVAIFNLQGEPYGAYAEAFSRTSKTNDGGVFKRSGQELLCAACDTPIDRLAGAPIVRAGILAHVLRVSHFGRAEQLAAPPKKFSPMPKPRRERK